MDYSGESNEYNSALLDTVEHSPQPPPQLQGGSGSGAAPAAEKGRGRGARLRGMGLMVGGVVLSHVNRFCMKEAFVTGGISSFEGMFFRCLFILVFNVAYAWGFKVDVLAVPPGLWKWLATRAGMGFLGGNLGYLALHTIDYSKAVVLEFTNPIFVGLFAACLLRERISKFDYLALLLAFLGVLIYANPSWLGGEDPADAAAAGGPQSHALVLGVLAAMGAAVTVSLGSVALRRLGQTVHYAIPTLYWSLTVCVLTPVIVILGNFPQHSHYSWLTFLLLMGSGAATFCSDMLITLASKHEKAGRLAALSYLEIIFGFILDASVFGGFIQLSDIVAACLIISCNLVLALLKCSGRIH